MSTVTRGLLLCLIAVTGGCVLDWSDSWPSPRVDGSDTRYSPDAIAEHDLGTDSDGPTVDLVPDGPTADLAPDATSDLPLPAEILWSAGHEGGNLDEWGGPDACYVDNGSCTLVSIPTHAGTWAVELALNPPDGGLGAAQLRRQQDLPEEGYYSAWYLIPLGAAAEPTDWYDIMIWHSTPSVSPMYVLGFDPSTGSDRNLVLRYRPQPGGGHPQWTSAVTLERGVWFHLEAYYHRHAGTDGEIRVWQDGQEIFHRKGDPTVLPGEELIWSVGPYTEMLRPGEGMTVFVDDAAIAIGNRVGP